MFLRHVIGGKHLSSRTDFVEMVQGATPDVVLTAVELLAAGLGPERPGAGDVVVVDVGGATTDVHSVVEVDPEDAGLAREVVATVPVSRTVEGDLGMRWSAVPTVNAAFEAGLQPAERLRDAARRRRDEPGMVPRSEGRTVRTTCRSRLRRWRWPCAGMPAASRWCSVRMAGSWSAAARTCGRSTCSSDRVVCFGMGRTRMRCGCWQRGPVTTSRAAGWCRAIRWS